MQMDLNGTLASRSVSVCVGFTCISQCEHGFLSEVSAHDISSLAFSIHRVPTADAVLSSGTLIEIIFTSPWLKNLV